MDFDALKKSGEAFYRIVEESFELERQGRSLIKLHIGSTGLPVPEVGLKVLREISAGTLAPYGPGPGLPELRAVAAEREGVSVDNIIVGPGSKYLLFSLLMTLKNDCSELVFSAPFWPAYLLIAEALGMKTRIVETSFEEGWKLPELNLKKNSLLLLCNPLNPTSTVYSAKELKGILQQVEESGSYLLLDEAYRDLTFSPLPSMADTSPATIRIRSFSKEFNLEGWRLGYAVLPGELNKRLTSLVHLSVGSASTLIQRVGIACLKHREELLPHHRGIWKERLDALTSALRANGFQFVPPQAGMYVFATHPAVTSGELLCSKGLQAGVVVAPGGSFGPFERFIRISASRESADLSKAVEILASSI